MNPDGLASPPARVPLILKGVVLLGLLLALAALALTVQRWSFLAGSMAADGIVVAVDREAMRDLDNRYQGTGYRLTVSFRADGGQAFLVRSPVTSSSTSARVGDVVRVNYPPGHPERAVLARWADRWLLPAVLGFIGAIALGIGGVGMWMMRQPGTRLVTMRGTAFAMQSGRVDRQGEAMMNDAPPNGRPSGGGLGRGPLILGAIVAALVIGFIVARMTGRSAQSTTTASTAGTSSTSDATSTNMQAQSSDRGQLFPSGSPPAGQGTQPGYPPPNMTVQAPPMNAPGFPPAPAPTPGIAGANGAPLLGMARAFLAKPTQDAAMQAALRSKAATLPQLCPALSFVPGDTLVANTPPPMFDAQGMLRRGLIRQRFTGVGCPNAAPLFNIWIYVADPNSAARTVAGFMGRSRADLALQHDATPIVLGIAARVVPQCRALTVLDTRLPAGSPEGVAGPWTEQWLVQGCGTYVQLGVHFIPDASGTRIEVPQTEAKVLNLS